MYGIPKGISKQWLDHPHHSFVSGHIASGSAEAFYPVDYWASAVGR